MVSPVHGRFTGAFKPANASKEIDGLFLAGGAAHPGPGMPMVMMSGWIAADALDQRYRGTEQPALHASRQKSCLRRRDEHAAAIAGERPSPQVSPALLSLFTLYLNGMYRVIFTLSASRTQNVFRVIRVR